MIARKVRNKLIAACCIVPLAFYGLSRLGDPENPATAAPSKIAASAVNSRAAVSEKSPQQAAIAELPSDQQPLEPASSSSAITSFHQWAEAATKGASVPDERKGLELAKARAAEMKALIQSDPAAALRQALPANLRAALPKAIAAAIEQPVNKTGTCSMRMMCNHASDAEHSNCQSTPVLLEDILSWNAYYGQQQWQPYLGQTVGFEGIAVEEELAVGSITPISSK
jgi:hypothetical protein